LFSLPTFLKVRARSSIDTKSFKENMVRLLSFPSLIDDPLWKANLYVFYKRHLQFPIEIPPTDFGTMGFDPADC
jgi:hypothetical protein